MTDLPPSPEPPRPAPPSGPEPLDKVSPPAPISARRDKSTAWATTFTVLGVLALLPGVGLICLGIFFYFSLHSEGPTNGTIPGPWFGIATAIVGVAMLIPGLVTIIAALVSKRGARRTSP